MTLKTVTFEFVWNTDDSPEDDMLLRNFAKALRYFVKTSNNQELMQHITGIRDHHHWPAVKDEFKEQSKQKGADGDGTTLR